MLFTLDPAVFVIGLVFPVVLAASNLESDGLAERRWGILLAVNGLSGAKAAYRIILRTFGLPAGIGKIAFRLWCDSDARGNLAICRGIVSMRSEAHQ